MIDVKLFIKAVKREGSVRAAARSLGIPKSTAQDLYKKTQTLALRESKVKKSVKIKRPSKGEVKRFILTSAQDQTKVHVPFFRNLEAYAEHLGAELLVSGFTYNKFLFEEHSKDRVWYAEEVAPYLTYDRFNLGDGIVFCGEMNIMPTATNPLSGLETYTREKWGIFPHAKVQQQSIATMKDSLAKMILTTGAVTRPNYILKKAGIKAHFHHVYGAVLVEICADGAFFVRHLLGDKKDGSFYDLTKFVKDAKIIDHQNVLAVTWGDIHIEKMDEKCFAASFGNSSEEGLLDYLKPKYQFIHDLIDFKARNHHNVKDPHFMYERFIQGDEKIEDAIIDASYFLQDVHRPWSNIYVVESNHDLALLTWLKTADYRLDPINAKLFLEAQLEVYKNIEKGNKNFSILEYLVKNRITNKDTDCFKFLKEDQSFVIAKEHGGIECAMHGHLGANGARGHARQFSKMGPKANTGHTHSASILDGIYTAGVSGSLDMGYNKGLSSWSHTHIITYKNGKRTLITISNGRFYA
jgi:hypothetical protein